VRAVTGSKQDQWLDEVRAYVQQRLEKSDLAAPDEHGDIWYEVNTFTPIRACDPARSRGCSHRNRSLKKFGEMQKVMKQMGASRRAVDCRGSRMRGPWSGSLRCPRLLGVRASPTPQ